MVRINDGSGSSYVKIDNNGALFAKDLEKWIDDLDPTGIGMRFKDLETGILYEIRKIDDN